VIELSGFKVVGEKGLLTEVGGVTIDYVKTSWSEGFAIKAGIPPAPSECGDCSC
jgi:Fe-S cluster assembly iron-binding protein IscA